MNKTSGTHRSATQRGYAMLGIIAAVGIATTALVVTSLSTTAVRNEQGRKDSNALALAKQALIANAASSNSRPGSLPCPDINNDGVSDYQDNNPALPCAARIGRLPWLTLGLADLRDAAGERLWYTVSLNFQDLAANRINSGITGQITLREGEQATAGVVAVVAAPGKPVGHQSRGTAQLNNYEHFLESYGEGTLTVNILAQDATHNDQLAVITPADIFSLVQRRVAKEVNVALQTYYAASAAPHSLPYPAQTELVDSGSYWYPATVVSPPFATTVITGYLPSNDAALVLPAWFTANSWNHVMQYKVDSGCLASAAAYNNCGTATFSVQSGSSLIGASGSGTIAMLGFAGVSSVYSNASSTVLTAGIQAQAQTQTQVQSN